MRVRGILYIFAFENQSLIIQNRQKMQNQNTLINNPNFKALADAYQSVIAAKNKQEKAFLTVGYSSKAIDAEYADACKSLKSLHSEYKALLEWIIQPENSEAKAQFSGLNMHKFLNAFFSA